MVHFCNGQFFVERSELCLVLRQGYQSDSENLCTKGIRATSVRVNESTVGPGIDPRIGSHAKLLLLDISLRYRASRDGPVINRRFAERMLLQGRYGFPAPTGRRQAHAAELRNFLPHRRGFQFPLAASEAQQRRNVALAVEAASAPVPTLQRD
ncbi:hypothetical protein SRHO_G00338220 [Serrasalmus rhombeus]